MRSARCRASSLAAAVLLILAPCALASAQEQLDVSTIFLGSHPCQILSASGDPNGMVTGRVCDVYLRIDTGKLYTKTSGDGTDTGWVPPGGLDGDVEAPIVEATAAVVRQKASGADHFASQWFVDGTSGATYLDAYDSADGGAYAPLVLRAARVSPAAPIGSRSYISQMSGWNVGTAGDADFRYLFTDELHAKSFIADLEQALAGGQIISKSVALVGAAFTVPSAGGASTLTVKDLPSAPDMAVFESGDVVRLRTFSRASGSLTITDAWGAVTSYADGADGLQTWTWTRFTAGNAGGMSGGETIPVDAVVLDYGTSGAGWYEVNAIDGVYAQNSPYAQVVTWAGTAPVSASQTLRARLGNLRGVTGTAGEYGLIAGTYAASNGQYFRASNSAFELHGINLSMWNGSTEVMRLSRTGPSLAMGATLPTSYSSGTGLWTGIDSGTYKFRVGNPAGNLLAWDGSTLTITGNGSGLTSINGGNITTGSITASQIATGTITADRMNVSTLSAIAANLGSVTVSTSGSLSSGKTSCTSGTGFWIAANSGTPQVCIGSGSGGFIWNGSSIQLYADGVEIDDAHGIKLDNAGSDSDFARSVWWSNGAIVQGRSDVSSLHLRSPGSTYSQINLYENDSIGFFGKSTGVQMNLDGGALFPETNGGLDLGKSSQRWNNIYVNNRIVLVGSSTTQTIQFDNGNFQGSTQYLCVDTDGNVFASSGGC